MVVPQDDAAATAAALRSPSSTIRTGGPSRAVGPASGRWTSSRGGPWPARYDDVLLRSVIAPRPRRTLAVVSDTPYYLDDGRPVGWGPNVREIDQLAALFDEVRHVAPLYDEPAPRSALRLAPAPTGSASTRSCPRVADTLAAKLRVLARYPAWARAIRREVAGADLVHVRCPSNISLLALGLFASPCRRPPLWLKYGGNWRPSAAEPGPTGSSASCCAGACGGARVTVNGEWPDEPDHVLAFRNPTLTPEELVRGRAGRGQGAHRARPPALRRPPRPGQGGQPVDRDPRRPPVGGTGPCTSTSSATVRERMADAGGRRPRTASRTR